MARFDFKRFSVDDCGCAMKVGTDSVLLGAWTDFADTSEIIDLGAGSGILSLMAAQRCPDAHITALEIEPDACAAATSNAKASPWHQNIHVACTDALGYEPERKVDLIICNPPYFSNSLKAPDEQRSRARHADGLGPLTCIILSCNWLSSNGSLAMVTPADYDPQITFAAEMSRMKVWRKCMVSTVEGKAATRILWQISRDTSKRYEPSHLSIRNSIDNSYTNEYRQLTQDFYLHL